MRPIYPLSLFVCLILLSCLSGCDSVIYDDLSNCPQGVIFRFAETTPCDAKPTYPSDIKHVRVFAFDEYDILVDIFEDDRVSLSDTYELKVPFKSSGMYSFVAWAGADLKSYTFTGMEKGKSSKSQLMVSLPPSGADPGIPAHIFVGRAANTLDLEGQEQVGTVYHPIDINLRELTNRIHLTLIGLPTYRNYAISLRVSNGKYDALGSLLPDDPFTYTPEVHVDGDRVKADFTILKLEQGKEYTLTVTDKVDGKVVYTADLLKDIILAPQASGETPPYSLECDNDFDIQLTLQYTPDSWMVVSGFVNDWNVIRRDITPGN